MDNFVMKTFGTSYLYNNKVTNQDGQNPADKANKAIKDFIINSERINKDSDEFRGIIEEIKRQQRSSMYYSILSMPNVQFCINQYEMPRAFKVFDAKDSKREGKPTVFIDVTGLIEMKNGYYCCRNISVLTTYIAEAAIYLLYRHNHTKLIDNSIITITATECYVSMFAYIVDYLRIIGYSTNKSRINYFVALYFLSNMMGKNIEDNYIKNIAAKVSGVSATELNALNYYMQDGMFENVYTFITSLSNQFKLKGLTLEVFVQKWIVLFGNGTQYGCELFTSFLNMITATYSASYIVNQKQIERCCGTQNIIKIFSAIEKGAVESFDGRSFMRENKEYESHDKNTCILAESMKNKDNILLNSKISEKDFDNMDLVKEEAKDIVSKFNDNYLAEKLPKVVEDAIRNGISAANKSFNNLLEADENVTECVDYIYDEGALTEVAKVFKNKISNNQRHNLNTLIENTISSIVEKIYKSSCSKEVAQYGSRLISEMREVKKYI